MSVNEPISQQSSWMQWLLKTNTDDPILKRQGQMAAAVLLIAEALTILVFLLSNSGNAMGELTSYRWLIGLFFGLIFVVYVVNRQGKPLVAGVAFSLVLLSINIILLTVTDPLSSIAVSLVVPVIVAGLFSLPVSAIIIGAVAGITYLILNIVLTPNYFDLFFSSSIGLQSGLVYLNLFFVSAMSYLFSRTTREALEESQELSLALIEQREELERRLEAQTRRLQATVIVARSVAGERDLDKLLADIVETVKETFGYYHVQVFLTDEEKRYAVLRQSTGQVGETLMARGHRLSVGSLSVIGQVTSSGEHVIARDTDKDVYHKRNELLPRTRSEMALPLIVGERIIGALDLQSVDPDAFPEDAIPTLQALTDQLAIAIENARLFEQTQENLRELRELSRTSTRESWAGFLAEAREEEKRSIYGPEPGAISMLRSRVMKRIFSSGSVIVSSGKDGRQSFIAAPIIIRNEVIGVIGVEPDAAREWSRDDLNLIQGIANRTASAIENARLFIQSQRAVDRERLINTISSRLQRSPNLALLLENTVRELAEVLGTENVYAEINVNQPLGRVETNESDDEVQIVEGETESETVESVAQEETQEDSSDAVSPGEPEEAKAEEL